MSRSSNPVIATGFGARIAQAVVSGTLPPQKPQIPQNRGKKTMNHDTVICYRAVSVHEDAEGRRSIVDIKELPYDRKVTKGARERQLGRLINNLLEVQGCVDITITTRHKED